MCPSFRATREEQHSTRGRARMLFEMLRGDVLDTGWNSLEVKEALDLCLACKGCKGDCPVSVDVATYKSEFLAHFYEGHPRPAAALSMGRIDRWARLTHALPFGPTLANLVTQTPVLSALAKKLAGVTRQRPMPAFPTHTFRHWFHSRDTTRTPSSRAGSRGTVLLWADTFNNNFTPHTAQAAVAVLEDAGFRVHVPHRAPLLRDAPSTTSASSIRPGPTSSPSSRPLPQTSPPAPPSLSSSPPAPPSSKTSSATSFPTAHPPTASPPRSSSSRTSSKTSATNPPGSPVRPSSTATATTRPSGP